MEYKGKYNIFNSNLIKTYSLETRTSRVKLENFLKPSDIEKMDINISKEIYEKIEILSKFISLCHKKNKPVIFFTGAHLIKNGLSLLLVDLINRKIITHIAGNGATAIHDFEIALIGQTSENVVKVLKEGQFGMAYEFNYINLALNFGNKYKLGFGESLGKMICEKSFRDEILSMVLKSKSFKKFLYPESSIIATCYKNEIPFTTHVGIGTDVIDQHPTFEGEAKGGCSGRDFLIFVNEVVKLNKGGAFINIGSAVTGPEVVLKAVSMASNVGKSPRDIMMANFDLKEFPTNDYFDEYSQYYYFRDLKTVITRIPQSFSCNGFYIKGDQRQTIPLLYKKIIEKL